MEVRCPQCGGAVTVPPEAELLECPFCGTALAVDASGAVFHHVMLATVAEPEAASHLRRFLAGDLTVANLDREAEIEPARLEYFPFWAFEVEGTQGRRTVLMPAAPSSLQGLSGLDLPGGDTRPWREGITGEAPVLPAEIPLETAREWLEQREDGARILRTVLYHLPLYRLGYRWRGRRWVAAVDGITGRVFPADYPAKAEAPFVLVAALAVAAFGLEGLLIRSLLLKALAYLVTSVPLMAVAWLTARRV